MRRLCFAFLAVLFSLLTIFAGVRAPLAAAQTGTSAPSASPEGQTPVEVPSLRTRYSRTYQVGDQFHAHITAAPQNFKAADGSWQVIDDHFVPTARAGFAYQNAADDPTVLLPSTLASGPVHLETGASWVSFALTGQNSPSSPASLQDSTATYAIPTGSITETASPSGLTEALTLSGATAPSTYTWNLATSSDLTPQETISGGIDFLNTSGQVVLTMPAPVMTDAAGNSSFNVHLSVAQTSLGQTLTLTADPTWLADPARVYPVTIDPSTYTTSVSQGCTLDSQAPTTSSCSGAPFTVQAPSYSNPTTQDAILQFNVSSIPRTDDILDSQLGLHLTSATTSVGLSATVAACEMTQSWTTSATWNTYDGTSPWPSRYSSCGAPIASTAYSIGTTVPSWTTFGLDQLVQGWVDGLIPNDGVLLAADSISTLTYDSAVSNPADAPYLDVWYGPWRGAPAQFTFADTVNTAGAQVQVGNGNLVLSHADLAMPGLGLPLTVTRTFNGLWANNRDIFGNGWSSSIASTTLYWFGNGDMAYYAPDGSDWPFQLAQYGITNPTFISPPGLDADLVDNHNGTYTLTFRATGESLHFTGGRLTSEADRDGHTETFTYDASHRLSTITDTLGGTTTFAYTSPVSSTIVTQITDPAGHIYQYSYDNNGNLISYTDPNNKTTQYSYNSHDELTQVTDPDGNETKFTYGSWQVTSIDAVTDPSTGAGNTTTFTYNAGNTIVTDALGGQTTYSYDGLLRVTALKNAVGSSWETSWNADDQPTQIQDADGGVSTISYNSSDEPTSTKSPAGVTQTLTYNTVPPGSSGDSPQAYQPGEVQDAQGNATYYGYNSTGDVTSATDPKGNTTTLTYTGQQEVQSVTDPNAHTTSYGYTSGLPTSVTPPGPLGSQSTSYTMGRQVYQHTDGRGDVATYQYNPDGWVTSVGYSDGTSVGYAYDNDGNVAALTDDSGTTSYQYNALGEVAEETLSGGVQVTYTWDAAGRMTGKTESMGSTNFGTTTYGYNAAGETTSITPPLGGTITIQYDANGNRTGITFPGGTTTTESYNADNNPMSIYTTNVVRAVLQDDEYTYTDSSGQTLDDVITACYGSGGQPDNEGGCHHYTYDSDGNIIEDDDTFRGVTTTYTWEYDPAGNLIQETQGGTVLNMNYNSANEATQVAGVNYTYDANGNVTSGPNGDCFNYDAAGNITGLKSACQNLLTWNWTGTDQNQVEQAGEAKFEQELAGLGIELDGPNTYQFISDPVTGLILGMIDGNNVYYFLTDANGSITAMVDGGGSAVATCSYSDAGAQSCQGSISVPLSYGENIPIDSGQYYADGCQLIDTADGLAQSACAGLEGDPPEDEGLDCVAVVVAGSQPIAGSKYKQLTALGMLTCLESISSATFTMRSRHYIPGKGWIDNLTIKQCNYDDVPAFSFSWCPKADPIGSNNVKLAKGGIGFGLWYVLGIVELDEKGEVPSIFFVRSTEVWLGSK